MRPAISADVMVRVEMPAIAALSPEQGRAFLGGIAAVIAAQHKEDDMAETLNQQKDAACAVLAEKLIKAMEWTSDVQAAENLHDELAAALREYMDCTVKAVRA